MTGRLLLLLLLLADWAAGANQEIVLVGADGLPRTRFGGIQFSQVEASKYWYAARPGASYFKLAAASGKDKAAELRLSVDGEIGTYEQADATVFQLQPQGLMACPVDRLPQNEWRVVYAIDQSVLAHENSTGTASNFIVMSQGEGEGPGFPAS